MTEQSSTPSQKQNVVRGSVIINSPLSEPSCYWDLTQRTPRKQSGRRPSSIAVRQPRENTDERFVEEISTKDLPLVNSLRVEVRRWRETGYAGVSPTTKSLLEHWRHPLRTQLFFCQLEAVETLIWLTEGRSQTKVPRDGLGNSAYRSVSEDGLKRLCIKMATGTGKTVVMAMCLAWQFCNYKANSLDERFAGQVLAITPNLTIKERLQVLNPQSEENYYKRFDLVPRDLLRAIMECKVKIINWHMMLRKNDNIKKGVVRRGVERNSTLVKRILSPLDMSERLFVINDEAHHAYRHHSEDSVEELDADSPHSLIDDERVATVWIRGLDCINEVLLARNKIGISAIFDLSATPFAAITGEGTFDGVFPWVVTDFSLSDAIESGLVKIPRSPVRDDSGRPDPKYFNLWQNILKSVSKGERDAKTGAIKPKALIREIQPSLSMLASRWKETARHFKSRGEAVPPVLLVAASGTKMSSLLAEYISRGSVLKEWSGDATLQFDSGVLLNSEATKSDSEQLLRLRASTVGRASWDDVAISSSDEALRQKLINEDHPPPGSKVKCVVSVSMLSEGWDAPNVTQILGLRAFSSPLLCEQILGRALRRMSYVLTDKGFLTPEYADVFGVPYTALPMEVQVVKEDKKETALTRIKSLEDRANMVIRFPVIESYVLTISEKLACDTAALTELEISPQFEVTTATVDAQVGHRKRREGKSIALDPETLDRENYYREHRLQKSIFEISRDIVDEICKTEDANDEMMRAKRSQYFPQILSFVTDYVYGKLVLSNGASREEIALDKYKNIIRQRIINGIKVYLPKEEIFPVSDCQGTMRSTDGIDFSTSKPCYETRHSHLSHAAYDSLLELQTMQFLDQRLTKSHGAYWVKNDRLGFSIPYEVEGIHKNYIPDFIIHLSAKDICHTLILEMKGRMTEDARAKESAAQKWVSAINNSKKFGNWSYRLAETLQDVKQIFESDTSTFCKQD